MAKEASNQKAIAVFGLGIFGRRLCETLAERGASVIAIDNQPDLVEQVKETVTQAILLDSSDENSLSQLPLEDVYQAVVAMGDSVEAGILTTALLKKLAVPNVIARAISPVHEQVLRQVGADEVLNLEVEAGDRLAARILAPREKERIHLSDNARLAEIQAPLSITGIPLAELDLRGTYGINVITINRRRQEVDETGNPVHQEEILFPGPQDTLRETDSIYVVGTDTSIDAFREL